MRIVRNNTMLYRCCCCILLLMATTTTTTTVAFRTAPISVTRKTSFLVTAPTAPVAQRPRRTASCSTGLSMFMGSDGGLLGVGTPEIATVLLVGYFVLGPSDLYKLTKEIGKFIQNIRTLGTDLTTTLESNMESQLQLEELRKAQRELNDAFSFRRSINTDDTGDAFSTTVDTPRPGTAQDNISASVVAGDDSTVNTTEGGTGPKKKIRRRVKRKVSPSTTTTTAESSSGWMNGNVPESLDMPSDGTSAVTSKVDPGQQSVNDKYANRPTDPFIQYTEEEQKLIDEEFDQYVSVSDDKNKESDDWSKETMTDDKVNSEGSSLRSATTTVAAAAADPKMQASATSRFQQQLSGSWNEQIMANQGQLEPLAKVMQLLASLEEEKIASTKRLEEEFRKRAEMEEEFYQKQRKVLEETAAQVQQQAAASSSQTYTSKS